MKPIELGTWLQVLLYGEWNEVGLQLSWPRLKEELHPFEVSFRTHSTGRATIRLGPIPFFFSAFGSLALQRQRCVQDPWSGSASWASFRTFQGVGTVGAEETPTRRLQRDKRWNETNELSKHLNML